MTLWLPMKPLSPSMTRILRWLRRSGRRQRRLSGSSGIMRRQRIPASVMRWQNCFQPGYLRLPRWSRRRRTVTPRATARSRAAKKTSVTSSQLMM